MILKSMTLTNMITKMTMKNQQNQPACKINVSIKEPGKLRGLNAKAAKMGVHYAQNVTYRQWTTLVVKKNAISFGVVK